MLTTCTDIRANWVTCHGHPDKTCATSQQFGASHLFQGPCLHVNGRHNHLTGPGTVDNQHGGSIIQLGSHPCNFANGVSFKNKLAGEIESMAPRVSTRHRKSLKPNQVEIHRHVTCHAINADILHLQTLCNGQPGQLLTFCQQHR